MQDQMNQINTKEQSSFLLRLKKHWLFLLLILTAFFLRIYLLRFRPVPEGDGCLYLMYAKEFLRGDFSVIGTYWSPLWVSLITLFSFVFGNVELSGYLLSVFFGVMLIALAFIFARRIFNERVAYYTALLLTANLGLLNYSTRTYTESFYGFLLFGIAYAGWVSLERQKNGYFFLLGMLIGLTYTARPEALVYLFVFFILILITKRKKAFLALLTFCAGASIFILSVVFFYRVQCKIWTLGSKGRESFFVGENPEASTKKRAELGDLYYEKIQDEINQKGMLVYLAENRFFIKRVSINYKKFFTYMPLQFLTLPRGGHLLSIIFFVLGSWACLFVYKGGRKKYLYLLLFPFIGISILASCHVEERKLIPFIVFFVFIISCGADWLQTVISNKPAKFLHALFLIGLFSLSSVMALHKASEGPFDSLRMKEIALWLRDHLSQEERIIVGEPVIPYYFYEKHPNNYLGLIYAQDYQTLARYMKDHDSKYLFIYSWLIPNNPVVDFLFNHQVDEFVLIKSFSKDNSEIRLYELK